MLQRNNEKKSQVKKRFCKKDGRRVAEKRISGQIKNQE